MATEPLTLDMPMYQSHKILYALKLAAVLTVADDQVEIEFEDHRFPKRIFNLKGKPTPQPGWYYVQYEDGNYESFCPADVFERGNHRTNRIEQSHGPTAYLIDHWFTYHAPRGPKEVERYVSIRLKARQLAHLFDVSVEDCADKTLAFNKLRDAVMAMNQAIACNQVPEA